MTPSPKLTIRSLRVRAVDVPLARPLQTGGGLVRSAPLALIDLETKEGVIGSSYLFCVTPTALKPTAQLLQNLAEWLADGLYSRIGSNACCTSGCGSWEYKG